MSGDRYIISDQHQIHFLTFTIVEWVDLFTRPEYKDIIVDSLNYCIRSKGMECFAWVLMTNHMHIIVRTAPPFKLADVIRDFKKYTSKTLIKAIQEVPESRRDWLLHKFQFAAHNTGRADNYKVWQDGYHGICVDGDFTRMQQRVNYIHNNPVRQLIVGRAEDYLHSRACDYSGIKGLVNVSVL